MGGCRIEFPCQCGGVKEDLRLFILRSMKGEKHTHLNTLARMKCVACRSGEPTVAEAEIAGYVPLIPDWKIVESSGVRRLERVFAVKDFVQALAFTNQVGELAEAEGHHPAILTEWGRVTVTWWTHKINGLHRNDFIMAAKTDSVYMEKTDRADSVASNDLSSRERHCRSVQTL
jgi:4a-hydroxytetrahydrobiopterin dehydratase